MVWQKEGMGLSYQQIAMNLCVDQYTVYRTLQRFRRTGLVMKKPYPKGRAKRKITEPAQLLILTLVTTKPGIYLHEIQNELINTLLLSVSISAICKFLHKSGFTRCKITHVALQRDQFLREKFVCDMSTLTSDMFVYVDETGADRRSRLRRYGYTLRGKELKDHCLLVRGERVSAIACMSNRGLLDVKTLTGTTIFQFFSS